MTNADVATKKYQNFDMVVSKANGILKSHESFSKVFKMANAVQAITVFLTDEEMAPIMELQNRTVGFKTDKENGYPLNVVRDCLIDAMVAGVVPVFNNFNIIGGRAYITKEGFFSLLNEIEELEYYTVEPITETFKQNGNVADIKCIMTYKISGFDPVVFEKMYKIKNHAQYGSYDAVVGKCERKGRKDIYEKITGVELLDGDVETGLDPNKAVKPKEDAANVENGLFNKD